MMTSTELTELRQRMGLTQAQMGDGMGGMSGRAYREIESAPGFISLRHEMLAERFALSMAVEAADPRYLPSRLRSDVVSACASLNAPQSIAGQSSSAMAERRKWIAFAGKLLALCRKLVVWRRMSADSAPVFTFVWSSATLDFYLRSSHRSRGASKN